MGCPASVEIGDNLVFSVTTHDPDTGILTDAESPPLYRIYEDEVATPILTGTMSILDNGNTTGFYTELIACTTAAGFEGGKTYTIYIEATVDGDTGGITYAFKADGDRVITAPTVAGTATGRLDMHKADTTVDGYASIYVRQTTRRTATGHGDSKEWRELVSDALGVIEAPFWKSQAYEGKRGHDGVTVAFTVGTDNTFYLPSVLGEP